MPGSNAALRNGEDGVDQGRLVRDVGEDGTVVLSDSRECASAPNTVMDVVEGPCSWPVDDVSDLENLQALARSRFGKSMSAQDVRAVLDSLVDKRLMVRSGGAYLDLATPPQQGRWVGLSSDQSRAPAP